MAAAKGPFELFMGDVGRYLEEVRSQGDANVARLWHAILYLQRAVQALADRQSQEATLEELHKRIDTAIGIVGNCRQLLAENDVGFTKAILMYLEEAIATLKGEPP